LIRNNWL